MSSVMNYVMEAYAGKTKELIQCEGYLREISDMINKNYESYVKYNTPITRKFEPCQKLEKTLASFFSVNEVAIYWKAGMVNAYTWPGSSIMIAKRTNDGDFSGTKLHIVIYDNLVYNAQLNERELMAVLLHEIGNCFYSSEVLVFNELLGIVLRPISTVIGFVRMEVAKGIDAFCDWARRKVPGVSKLFSTYNQLFLQIGTIKKYLIGIPSPTKIAAVVARNASNPLNVIGSYGNERGADTFAAKYGYGGDQITALKKLHRPENTVALKVLDNAGALGDFIKDYNDIIHSLVGALILDAHPNNDVRAQTMIRKLERDLETGDYPPELKSDLQKEIQRLKEIHKTIYDNESNVELQKGWYNMLNAITHGHSNIQELLNGLYIEHEF